MYIIPPEPCWVPFSGMDEKKEFYRRWGLGSRPDRQIMYTGLSGDPLIPCEIVGHQGNDWAVVQVHGELGCIHGEYLAERQPKTGQKLARGLRLGDVLQDYIVLDIETTGFHIADDRIIEIAAIHYQMGRKVEVFHQIINPHRVLPQEITALTGLTQKDVADGCELNEISHAFPAFTAQLPLVGHNAAAFDLPFLRTQLQAAFSNPLIDTLPLAREAFPQLTCHKLEYLNQVLQLNAGRSHRALADVEATNALLWACLTPRGFEDQIWIAICTQPVRKRASGKAAVR